MTDSVTRGVIGTDDRLDRLSTDGLDPGGLLCRARPVFPGTAGIDPTMQQRNQEPLPGRLYLFVLSDEILPSGKLVRKVLVLPDHTATELIASRPEIHGLKPQAPGALVSIGEHALGSNKSPYISASSLPKGAPNISGRPVYIDIRKAKAAGATIHSTEEIIADLDRIARTSPETRPRIEKLKVAIQTVEREVLIEGDVPASAIKSAGSMSATRYVRYVQTVGIVFTAYDMGSATLKSIRNDTPKPIVAETIRQVGGWGGAWTGTQIGGSLGAAVGIETGPGAIVTGAIGAVVFGIAGYFGADWLADMIDEN